MGILDSATWMSEFQILNARCRIVTHLVYFAFSIAHSYTRSVVWMKHTAIRSETF